MNTFPIGFWNYASIVHLDESCVQDWGDAGMTLAMSPEFNPEPAHVQSMHRILDAAQERGIRVILCYSQTYWHALTERGEEAYRQGMQEAIREFGAHPAVFGFHVGDEPDSHQFPDACRAMRIQKELAPNLIPFCNLLPWHQGCEPRVGYESWAAYLDAYVAQARPDLLCYDCYSQMNPGTEGWDMYFRNLREYQEAGQRHGRPFWTTLLSVGHFRYRCPTEDDFRWQVNTAVAHGAQGLLWFFFYMRQPHDNYRLAPIDEHWERTETFERLSRVNRTFLKWHAPVVRPLTLQRVQHVGQAWGGIPAFDGGGFVSRARSVHGTPLIVSEFTDRDGHEYAMVVNNSQTESTQAELWFRGRHPQAYRVEWTAKEARVTPAAGQSGEDYVLVRPWLAPGQMELYRIAHQDIV